VISILAILFHVLISLIPSNPESNEVRTIPAKPAYSPEYAEAADWSEYFADAVQEYSDEFTKLFNSYETKRAKNGAILIRQGNSGSFKFAKKG
jgi:hypothetical protein